MSLFVYSGKTRNDIKKEVYQGVEKERMPSYSIHHFHNSGIVYGEAVSKTSLACDSSKANFYCKTDWQQMGVITIWKLFHDLDAKSRRPDFLVDRCPFHQWLAPKTGKASECII